SPAAAVEHQLAAVSHHFHHLRAGSLAGTGDEDAAGAVGVFEVGGAFILGLDVVVLAPAAERADALRHAADPLEQIEIVRRLVHQHAAPFARPGAAPTARIVVDLRAQPGGDHVHGALDFTQFAGRDQFAHLLMTRAGALIEHDAEDFSR